MRRCRIEVLLLAASLAQAAGGSAGDDGRPVSLEKRSVRGRRLQSSESGNESSSEEDMNLPRVCPPKPILTMLDQKPMCQACAPIEIEDPVKRCMFNVTSCASVQPGENCQIDCAQPYVRVGEKQNGTCALGNSIPGRMLVWDEPTCVCPEPQAQQGYSKDSRGHWQCTEGFAGTPEIKCEPLPSCEGVNTFLTGCKKLQPCAMPSVDKCRFDVSRCTSVQPGGSCQVFCQKPWLGNFTVAVCKDLNTDPDTELDYYPLTCQLEDCPDPSPWPEGYNKTVDGKWTCAEGYNGTARNLCDLGNSFNQDCAAVAALSGCYKVVDCLAPEVFGLDLCKYDMAACQRVAPGETCEVHCKNPFTGAKTVASCPEGNVNPNGLIWEAPMCGLDSCDEPGNVPAGYMRMGDAGWQCAQSFTGFAVKECEATLSCEARPVLTGCNQLVPCQAPESNDCRYNLYGCASVQPGETCQIECQVPFAGTTTVAVCPFGNTDPLGLVWSPPECEIDTCADPPPGLGYRKLDGLWECAPGYAGTVVKTCVWQEAECRATPELSGCVAEKPCALPDLNQHQLCMYDTSECRGLLPGKMCSIKCQAPYLGPSSDFTCPVANTDPNQTIQGTWPECGCDEQIPLPEGYNMTRNEIDLTVTYACEAGYGGKAEKMCQPGAGFTCSVDPVMVGCAIPVVCEASWFEDGSGGGVMRGAVNFGPGMLSGTVDEADILNYEVYWADDCEEPLGVEIERVDVIPDGETCCRGNVYSVPVNGAPPTGAKGFLVMARLDSGRAPVGIFVGLNETSLNRAIAFSPAAATARPAWAYLALCAFASVGLVRR
eukprot:TRINITY_DN105846_c0_g1_i1.p1 TRINITY_DN105846_c0_g1~~TRINITY_DN105846_c0_g1_i1.p1  ORF type:complete len:841 (+),score=145.06 TRINITY_DN105846_c0_g1_i1:52-2523(+)